MIQPPSIPESDWLIDYTPFRSLPLDQEALRIYEHAYQVGMRTEMPDAPKISFSTLLIALFRGEDETSRWFAERATSGLGPLPGAVYLSKGLDSQAVDAIPRVAGPPPTIQLSTSDRQLLTESARAVLENAERWAHQVGGSDIGVRHLVAAYVLNPPPNHRSQMQGWMFQEYLWRKEFFAWVAERYTAEQWTDASYRPAPSRSVPTFEQQTIKGETIAFPADEDARKVLDRAAELHARRGEQWLQLQTVFFALLDVANSSDSIRSAIQPIWAATHKDDSTYEQVRDAYFSNPKGEDGLDFSSLDITPRVLNALETARELAVAIKHDFEGEVEVGVLHLAGALISRRVDNDAALVALGLTPQKLRKDLIAHAEKQGESGEAWGEALGEEESLQAGRPVELNSDEPEAVVRLDEKWTSDPLSIRPDVEAFAALLASKTLEPPLSIGLFGPWGSGKTTFLRRLHRAVQTLADEATKKQTPYVSNIVHVEFNAWHFAEDALTSSLVDTILRALSAYINDDPIAVGEAQRKVKLAQLESTKRKLEAAEAVKQAAQTAVTQAETDLVAARGTAAQAISGLQAVVQGVWNTTRSELLRSREVKESGVLEAVGDTVKSGEELEAKLDSIRTRPARLLNDLGWGRSILFAVLVLVLPPLIGWLVGRAAGLTGEVASTMTTMLVIAGGWLRSATQAAAKVDRAIDQVASEYDRRIEASDEVKAAQKKFDEAQTSAVTAETSVQAAREALAKAQAEAANASLPAQMLQLVSSRIEDQTYNKELTTLSLARADLQALSLLFRDQRIAAPAPPPTNGTTPATKPPKQVDRVILYIDDLDRCKPNDVVRVLQLVHMLLAFELFVVVVAVDARWVEEALVNSYKWLATEEEEKDQTVPPEGDQPKPPSVSSHVTPQDYLEKIFQISFWLEPMTSARAASYLGSLVRPQDGSKDGKIDISSTELDYMRALAAYVGPSPRRVKRLVNAYRLIKARLSNSQLEKFVDRATTSGGRASGPYQLVIGLLVIGTGAPATSAQILRELAESDPTDSYDRVIERFREREHPDWTMASKVIETLLRTQKANDVSELRGWARKVGRFLLKGPTAEVG